MISVCIATYNGEKYIKTQLLSIMKQLQSHDEIIISDDGSCDKTIEIVKSLHSPLIKIFTNEGEHGYTPNFENALRQAIGDIIFLSDQDDIWKDDKVKTVLQYMKRYDVVVSDATMLDESKKVIVESFFQLRHPYQSFWGNLLKFGYLGCCMAFKRKILDRALPFPKDHKKCTHDNWLFLIGKLYYKTYITNAKLIYYCRHENNTSTGGLSPTTSAMFKIRYRLYLIKHLAKRFGTKNMNKH